MGGVHAGSMENGFGLQRGVQNGCQRLGHRQFTRLSVHHAAPSATSAPTFVCAYSDDVDELNLHTRVHRVKLGSVLA